jgi:hypothetical protein
LHADSTTHVATRLPTSPWAEVPDFNLLSASAPGCHPWLLLAALGEKQIGFAADCAGTVLKGLETLGRVQEQVAHGAVVRHQRAMAITRQAAEPARLMALPWALLMVDLDAANRYWQALARATIDQVATLQQCVSRHLAEEQQVGAGLLPRLARWQ